MPLSWTRGARAGCRLRDEIKDSFRELQLDLEGRVQEIESRLPQD